MSGPLVIPTIDDLHTVTLADVDAVAALQTRTDRKYVVDHEQLDEVIRQTRAHLRVLAIDDRQAFAYESVYFDTPELRCYHDTARRRPHRFKVRTRAYLDTGRCLLEVKRKDPRGRTVKDRQEHPFQHRRRLPPAAIDFIASLPAIGANADDLRPTLTTSYHRSTLLVGDGEGRATIDVDLAARDELGADVDLGHIVLIETKSAGRPSTLDRALWKIHVRPVTISKYCTSLAAIRTNLPSNRWHRTLNRLESGKAPKDAPPTYRPAGERP